MHDIHCNFIKATIFLRSIDMKYFPNNLNLKV